MSNYHSKQVILRAGLLVEQKVGRLLWYCADGANIMQPKGNGVAGLLMKLQQEVSGYSLLVPVHANCHRADLAFCDAMDNNHEFLDHVADNMNAIAVWCRNAPTRLCNMPFAGLANIPFAIHLAQPAALGGICESH